MSASGNNSTQSTPVCTPSSSPSRPTLVADRTQELMRRNRRRDSENVLTTTANPAPPPRRDKIVEVRQRKREKGKANAHHSTCGRACRISSRCNTTRGSCRNTLMRLCCQTSVASFRKQRHFAPRSHRLGQRRNRFAPRRRRRFLPRRPLWSQRCVQGSSNSRERNKQGRPPL